MYAPNKDGAIIPSFEVWLASEDRFTGKKISKLLLFIINNHLLCCVHGLCNNYYLVPRSSAFRAARSPPLGQIGILHSDCSCFGLFAR